MVREVSGDILLSTADAIVHSVAPYDHFDRGLALALRERWPALAKDFRHYCRTQSPHVGTLWSWGTANSPRIICLLTQEAATKDGDRPGPAHVEHLNHALRELRRFVEEEHFSRIAVPRLATGEGRLGWERVYPLILKHLSGLQAEVDLFMAYNPNQTPIDLLSRFSRPSAAHDARR